jgi:Sec-independent protein translocase protein TatA
MKVSIPVSYSQWDDRWSKEYLGFNTSLPWNIYNYGCLLACLAMVCKYYGKDENPLSLNNLLKSKKGFVANSGEYVWGSITKCYSDIVERKTETPTKLTDTQIQEIKTALDNNYPVMLEVDYNPKTVKADMHFVLAVDYNPSDENDFTIIDPLGGKTESLKKYLGWYKPSCRDSIERYVVYEGKVPEESAGKVLIDKSELKTFNYVKEQWVKLVSYLEIGSNPNTTPFEDAQKVIGGYKSRVTDVQNQLDIAKTEVKNREEQVSRLKEQLLEQEKLQKALSDQLNEALKNSGNVAGLYEGRIKELQGQIDSISKEKGALNITISQLQTEIKNLENKVENLVALTVNDMPLSTLILYVVKKLLSKISLKGGEKNAVK